MNGDSSCPELVQFVHCRNCQVYSNAGARLLERPPPPGYRRERTEYYALEKESRPAKIASALFFRIHAEWLALPAQAIQEIAERRTLHSLPHRRQGIVLGLANVRGELLICVSLGRLFGMEQIEPGDKAQVTFDRLLVARWNGQRLVFPVDEVQGVHRFTPGDLMEAPPTVGKSKPAYTQGLLAWNGRGVGFLDADLLFSTLGRSLS